MFKFLSESIKLLFWILSILFLPYFTFLFVFTNLFPDLSILSSQKSLLELDKRDLGILFLLILMISSAGFIIRAIEKKVKLSIFPLKSRSEIIILLISSYFLSFFYIRVFLNIQNLEYIFIAILTLVFFILLSNLLFYWLQADFDYFKNLILRPYSFEDFLSKSRLTIKNIGIDFSNFSKALYDSIILELIKIYSVFLLFKKRITISINPNSIREELKDDVIKSFLFLRKRIKISIKPIFLKEELEKEPFKTIISSDIYFRLFKSLMLGIIIIVIFVSIIGYLHIKLTDYAQYQKKLRESLVILKVIPGATTLAEVVKLQGYNFSWRLDRRDKLMSDYGRVMVEEWTNEQITFFVPLNWEQGKVGLWIEKYKTDTRPHIKLISNTVIINIASRWDYYPTLEEVESKDIFSYVSKAIKKIKRTLLKNQIYR